MSAKSRPSPTLCCSLPLHLSPHLTRHHHHHHLLQEAPHCHPHSRRTSLLPWSCEWRQARLLHWWFRVRNEHTTVLGLPTLIVAFPLCCRPHAALACHSQSASTHSDMPTSPRLPWATFTVWHSPMMALREWKPQDARTRKATRLC